ncbi:tRNA (adenosine(37)-N6)-dimethylallyltransferase MiaA [Leekyejoonella antrihumi]|uniref:tRNA dimethylallyltransferase n=1 Tax=Leekyejoonella antrihumi TaxID=1660198 RepID=A0A563E6X5_9MICO|nr:tRNA (adenosine(37)-N6)-dimethylallyltransferase MiaA [Leekyejoonella antrihumi]TWP37594.1 tRNA (adenosine(37)-N6)-dimethylallyltransferase MiaA [Leekyejoonella antrihumi]
MSAPEIIAVVGPTAVGKSDLGVALAHALDGEIVNADASQLYRGMDIGTAKLTMAQRAGVPHHQLDVLDVRDEASVAAYQRHSREDLDRIRASGRQPILVGGSGLYVRASLDHLEIPPTDPQVRAAWEERLQERGTAELHAVLAERDPVAAAQILATNGRRIVRALEVIDVTGRPFSATMPTRTYERPTLMIGLKAPREVLDERIEQRVHHMWEAGLLEEVRGLIDHGLRDGRTASRAIGYAQALAQIDGRLGEEEARTSTCSATRKLARRQLSWFRPDPRVVWLPHDAANLTDRALQAVRAAAQVDARG